MVLAPHRSVSGLARVVRLIFMRGHLCSDTAWKQGLSIPKDALLSDGPALGNSSGFQQNPALGRMSRDAAASSRDKSLVALGALVLSWEGGSQQ